MRCVECEIPLFLQSGDRNPKCPDCKSKTPLWRLQTNDHIYPRNFTSGVIRNKVLLSIEAGSSSSNDTVAVKRSYEEQVAESRRKRLKMHIDRRMATKTVPLVIDLAFSDDEDDVFNRLNSKPSSSKNEGTKSNLQMTEASKPVTVKIEKISEEDSCQQAKKDSEMNKEHIDSTQLKSEVSPGFCRIKPSQTPETSSSQSKTEVNPSGNSSSGSESLNLSLLETNKGANRSSILRGMEGFFSFKSSDQKSLEASRSMEKELNEKMLAISSDPAVQEIATALREKISELKMKRLALQETIQRKESNITLLESKCNRLLVILTTCKKERDCVQFYLKDADVRVERARKCMRDCDEEVMNAQQDLDNLVDPELVHLFIGGLKNKEKRAASAKVELERSVASLKEIQEDLARAEEELEVHESSYALTLQKLEKEKTDLQTLKENDESNSESDVVRFDCQLKGFKEEDVSKVYQLHELEGKFIHMQCLRRKTELAIKTKTVAQFLPNPSKI